jgi:hypothetical protein
VPLFKFVQVFIFLNYLIIYFRNPYSHFLTFLFVSKHYNNNQGSGSERSGSGSKGAMDMGSVIAAMQEDPDDRSPGRSPMASPRPHDNMNNSGNPRPTQVIRKHAPAPVATVAADEDERRSIDEFVEMERMLNVSNLSYCIIFAFRSHFGSIVRFFV